MKSYQKHIRFENIQLKVEKTHPKDISRVHFKIIQPNNSVYKTKKYGTVNPTDITWSSPIQFDYTAQPTFKFETICQHQYGYEIEQLKALYYGQIKIKPQDFFVTNTFPVYNKQGVKCGKVSFMIKIADRQKGVKYNEDDQVQNKQRIKVDLVARITFVQAILQINPLYVKDYQGKKSLDSKAQLFAIIDNLNFIANQKGHYHWIFKGNKLFQLFQKSQDKMVIRIVDNGVTVLEGTLLIDTLLKNKRFLSQNVIMQNQKGIKIGTLKIQMRIVQKKQILDLMYSPKKLQNTKMQKTDFQTEISKVVQNKSYLSRVNQKFQNKINSSQPILQKPNKRLSLDLKKDMTFMKLSRLQSPENNSQQKNQRKYDLYFRNQYQQIKFTQSKRFKQIKPNNPYVSYTGQYDLSDFSPKRKVRAANFSQTQRMDFTKPYKNNPGIGNYHLPSIWQRS